MHFQFLREISAGIAGIDESAVGLTAKEQVRLGKPIPERAKVNLGTDRAARDATICDREVEDTVVIVIEKAATPTGERTVDHRHARGRARIRIESLALGGP